MVEISYVITDPRGIHARPAGQLVKLLSKYKCSVQMGTKENKVDAKRLIAVMKLALAQGNELFLVFDGEDEKAASEAALEFLKSNL